MEISTRPKGYHERVRLVVLSLFALVDELIVIFTLGKVVPYFRASILFGDEENKTLDRISDWFDKNK
jgi:hypothetical protein